MAASHTSCPIVERPVAATSPVAVLPGNAPVARSVAPARQDPQHTRARTT